MKYMLFVVAVLVSVSAYAGIPAECDADHTDVTKGIRQDCLSKMVKGLTFRVVGSQVSLEGEVPKECSDKLSLSTSTKYGSSEYIIKVGTSTDQTSLMNCFFKNSSDDTDRDPVALCKKPKSVNASKNPCTVVMKTAFVPFKDTGEVKLSFAVPGGSSTESIQNPSPLHYVSSKDKKENDLCDAVKSKGEKLVAACKKAKSKKDRSSIKSFISLLENLDTEVQEKLKLSDEDKEEQLNTAKIMLLHILENEVDNASKKGTLKSLHKKIYRFGKDNKFLRGDCADLLDEVAKKLVDSDSKDFKTALKVLKDAQKLDETSARRKDMADLNAMRIEHAIKAGDYNTASKAFNDAMSSVQRDMRSAQFTNNTSAYQLAMKNYQYLMSVQSQISRNSSFMSSPMMMGNPFMGGSFSMMPMMSGYYPMGMGMGMMGGGMMGGGFLGGGLSFGFGF